MTLNGRGADVGIARGTRYLPFERKRRPSYCSYVAIQAFGDVERLSGGSDAAGEKSQSLTEMRWREG